MFIEEKRDDSSAYIKAHPEYTKENMDNYVMLHSDIDFPELALKLLIRNEYIYSLPYSERPKVDTIYDSALIEAISFLEKVE